MEGEAAEGLAQSRRTCLFVIGVSRVSTFHVACSVCAPGVGGNFIRPRRVLPRVVARLVYQVLATASRHAILRAYLAQADWTKKAVSWYCSDGDVPTLLERLQVLDRELTASPTEYVEKTPTVRSRVEKYANEPDKLRRYAGDVVARRMRILGTAQLIRTGFFADMYLTGVERAALVALAPREEPPSRSGRHRIKGLSDSDVDRWMAHHERVLDGQ